MSNKIHDILKGKFLTNEKAINTWKFIVFLMVLALIMTYTSHSVETKVHKISKLTSQVNELRSEYVDGQRRIMHMQMESTVAKQLVDRGIAPAQHPPQKIVIITKEGKDGNNR